MKRYIAAIRSVTLYDISGNKILDTGERNSFSVKIETAGMEAGLYIVKTFFADGSSRTGRVVIK